MEPVYSGLRNILLIVLLLSGGPMTLAWGESVFTYQGRLQSGEVGVNGLFDFEFRLFDAATDGRQIGYSQIEYGVSVSNGLFSVGLDFDDPAFDTQPRWLEIDVYDSTTGSYTTLTPRQQVSGSVFSIDTVAITRGTSDTAPLSSVTVKTVEAQATAGSGSLSASGEITSGTGFRFPDGTLQTTAATSGGIMINTGNGLSGGPITGSGTISVATAGITESMIANGAITADKVANSAISGKALAENGVTSIAIADGTIVNADIGTSAISSANIASNAVTSGKIAANAVSSANIVDATITNADIALLGVATSNLANDAVTALKLADYSVTTPKLGLAAVTGSRVAADAIDSANIVDHTIEAIDVSGALYNTRDGLYIVETEDLISSDAKVVLTASCNDPADIPIAGSCNSFLNYAFRILGQSHNNWTDTSEAASVECALHNAASFAATGNAQIVCLAPTP